MATQAPAPAPAPAGPRNYQSDWTSADATKVLKQQLAAFCGKVVALSKAAPPPGTNAANGKFRTAMLNDPELNTLAHPNSPAADADSAALVQLIAAFEQGDKNAFQPENYSSNAFTNSDLFLKALKDFGPQALQIAKDIIAIYAGKADPQKVKDDVDALIAAIEKEGAKLDGTHANGWIASNMKATAKTVGDSAKAAKSTLKGAESQKLADFVATVCQKLQDIPEYANNPWLYAEWQVQFEAIMNASSQALTS